MTHWTMENRRRFLRENYYACAYYCVYYLCYVYYFRYCVILSMENRRRFPYAGVC